MTHHKSKTSIVWHRGIDEDIPSMLVTKNLVCTARIFQSGKWVVSITLGTTSTFETGMSKNLEMSKQAAESSMVRCTQVLAQALLEWAEKHRAAEKKQKKGAES